MFSRLTTLYKGLTHRERMLVSAAVVALVLIILSYPISAISEKIDEDHRLEQVRAEDSKRVAELLSVYQRLDRRKKNVEATFAESQMTFEEVTSEIDRVVKSVVGAESYDLKQDRTPTKIGGAYDKQGFTLGLKSLTLEKLINLLHTIENDKRPLFLEKIHVERKSAENFSAQLDLFSIRKSET